MHKVFVPIAVLLVTKVTALTATKQTSTTSTTLSRLKFLSRPPHMRMTPFQALVDRDELEEEDLKRRVAQNGGL